MPSITHRIKEHAESQPEGTPISRKKLAQLGTRSAVNQALRRLVQRGTLVRACRGTYFAMVTNAYGTRPPVASSAVKGLVVHFGETVAQHAAATANAFGLTTQVPMRAIYLTSGRTRQLRLGCQTVELRHAPAWQLIFPGQLAGDVVRVLAWCGPHSAKEALLELWPKLTPADVRVLIAAQSRFPRWMARLFTAPTPPPHPASTAASPPASSPLLPLPAPPCTPDSPGSPDHAVSRSRSRGTPASATA